MILFLATFGAVGFLVSMVIIRLCLNRIEALERQMTTVLEICAYAQARLKSLPGGPAPGAPYRLYTRAEIEQFLLDDELLSPGGPSYDPP